ncbi:MAG TPA: response regulator [Noviherbaspirillum sp.]|nr:response regulator [Noviherbaspirillum sp.]
MGASTSGKRRILLVDDDRSTLALLTQILLQAGHEVEQASCGEAALSIALQHAPDLALLDVNMPGMSGVELARRLRAETGVPFMFLSADGDLGVVREATAHGAVGYQLKPVDPVRIVAAVQVALTQADEMRRLRQAEAAMAAALACEREISVAVGLLMARFQADRGTAFEVLREHARSSRRKMSDVAKDLLLAEKTFNAFASLFAARSISK